MTDPETLIPGWIADSLEKVELAALEECHKQDDAHLRRFTNTVIFEQQIQTTVVPNEQQAATNTFLIPVSIENQCATTYLIGFAVAVIFLSVRAQSESNPTFVSL